MAPKRAAAATVNSSSTESDDNVIMLDEPTIVTELQGMPQKKKQKVVQKGPRKGKELKRVVKVDLVPIAPRTLVELKTPGAMRILKDAGLEPFANIFPCPEDVEMVTQLVRNYDADLQTSTVNTPDGMEHEVNLTVDAISKSLHLSAEGFCPGRGKSTHHMNKRYFSKPSDNIKTNDGYYIKMLKGHDLQSASTFVQKTLEVNCARPHLLHGTPLRMLTHHLDPREFPAAPEVNWAKFVHEELREKLLIKPKHKTSMGSLLTYLIRDQTHFAAQTTGLGSPRSEEATTQKGQSSANIPADLPPPIVTSKGPHNQPAPVQTTPTPSPFMQFVPQPTTIQNAPLLSHPLDVPLATPDPIPVPLPMMQEGQFSDLFDFADLEKQLDQGSQEAGTSNVPQTTSFLANQAIKALLKVMKAAKMDAQKIQEAGEYKELNEGLQIELTRTLKSLDDQGKMLDEAKSLLAGVNKELQIAEKERREIFKRVQEQEDQLTICAGQIASLETTARQLTEAKAKAEEQLEAQVTYASNLSIEIAGLKQSKQEKEENITVLTLEKQEMKAVQGKLEKCLEQTNKENDELKESVQKIQREQERWKKEAEDSKRELQNIQKGEAEPMESEGTLKALHRATKDKEVYKQSYLQLKSSFDAKVAESSNEIYMLQGDKQRLADDLAERDSTLETMSVGQRQMHSFVKTMAEVQVLPHSIYDSYLILLNLLKTRLINNDFNWPEILELDSLEVLYSRCEEEERNILCLAYSLGHFQVPAHEDFCSVFPFAPLRVCAAYTSVINHIARCHQDPRNPKVCPPIEFILPSSSTPSEEDYDILLEKKKDIQPTFEALQQILLSAIQYLMTLPESQHYNPKGLASLYNKAIQHMKDCLDAKLNIPFVTQDVVWPTVFSASDLKAIEFCLPFRYSLILQREEQMAEGITLSSGEVLKMDWGEHEIDIPPATMTKIVPAFQPFAQSPPRPLTPMPENTELPVLIHKTREELIKEFEEQYPKELRGGWEEYERPIKEHQEIMGLQPEWRKEYMMKRHRFALYANAPRDIRVDPRFKPVPRRGKWNPETHIALTTTPINWPIVGSYNKTGWSSFTDVLRNFKEYYKKHETDVDPTIKESAANCKLMVILLELPLMYDNIFGPIIFDPNFKLPVGVISRLYFRVQTLSSANIFRFEQWVRTGWLVEAPLIFGPIDESDLGRYKFQEWWHKQVTKKKRGWWAFSKQDMLP